ncbi:MAG: DMT family transporter [Anaerolineales bacterium]|nr:DMT family transporter [Anaerolineales bacterium]
MAPSSFNPSGAVKPEEPPLSPYLPLIIGIIAAASSSILIRFAQREAPSLIIAAYRLGLATLFLLPSILNNQKSVFQALTGRHTGLIVLSGTFLALHFATWITSLEFTSVASSVVLVQTAPILVALLSPFFLQEQLRRSTWFGIGIAFAGSLLVSISDLCQVQSLRLLCPPAATLLEGTALKGDLLAIAGAASVTGYILIGRKIRNRVPLLPYLFLTYGTAAILLAATAFVAGQDFTGYTPITYLWLVLLALFPQLIAHSSVNWALRYLPAAIVSVFLLGEPVGSTILAVFILDEIPPPLRLFGGVLILAGILVTVVSPRRQSGLSG